MTYRAVCGVGSGIPLTLLVLLVARVMRGGGERQRDAEPIMTRPVMMTVPPQMVMPQMQEQRQPAVWHSVPQRDFQIVGEK